MCHGLLDTGNSSDKTGSISLRLNKIQITSIKDYTGCYREFCCGKPHINSFLKCEAELEHQNKSRGTQIIHSDEFLLGFLTKSIINIEMDHTVPDERRNFNCIHMDYLAIDKEFHRNGIGKIILETIILESIEIADKLGCRALTLCAESDVSDFYEKLGFRMLDYCDELDDYLWIIDFRIGSEG